MSAQPGGMGEEPPIVSRIGDIYDGLAAVYNASGQMESHNAAAQAEAWLGSELAVKSDDHWFATCTCYGPWNLERQKQIWENVGPSFETEPFCGDLRRIEKDNVRALGFPFPWQKRHLVRMSAYLRGKNLSFHELCEQLRQRSGTEARKAIAEIVGAGDAKTISVFVRDCLHLSAFPIDTRVGQLLWRLGLPEREDVIICLCKAARRDSSVLNRMLYEHWSLCEQDNKIDTCPVAHRCYVGQLRWRCHSGLPAVGGPAHP